MKCINHPERDAVAVCISCHSPLCAECRTHVKGKIYCEKCVNTLFPEPSAEVYIKPMDIKAGFGIRFIARLLDGLILLIPVIIANLIIPFSGFIIWYGYFTYFYGTTGQTYGKKWMKLRVVTTDGSPLTYGKGFLRSIGYFISEIPLFLGYFWIIWDANKQGFHDKIAETYVILES